MLVAGACGGLPYESHRFKVEAPGGTQLIAVRPLIAASVRKLVAGMAVEPSVERRPKAPRVHFGCKYM